jgi:hypothetical protein
MALTKLRVCQPHLDAVADHRVRIGRGYLTEKQVRLYTEGGFCQMCDKPESFDVKYKRMTKTEFGKHLLFRREGDGFEMKGPHGWLPVAKKTAKQLAEMAADPTIEFVPSWCVVPLGPHVPLQAMKAFGVFLIPGLYKTRGKA